MPDSFPCPYLASDVELTDERRQHIIVEHDDFEPYMDFIGSTLLQPDVVRRSRRDPATRLLYRWYDDAKRGKYVVVVVVADAPPARRHWVVTAYLARRATGGVLEWERS
jgi:hypothetical protein